MFEGENDFGFVPGGSEEVFGDGVPSSLDELVDWLDIAGETTPLKTTAGPHGVAGDSSVVTSSTATAQPSTSMSDKFMCQDDFLADTFDTVFDMDMFGDLGSSFDPLGDESLDSFTDLSALLSQETAFLDEMKPEETAPFPDLSDNVKATTMPTASLKRSFDEMEAGASDSDDLPAHVGLATSSNLDHDYSSKRPRLSTATEEPVVEGVFLAPAPLLPPAPTPSTSYVITASPEDKTRNRREKNNVASKRSREIRKKKFIDMEAEAEHLLIDNARLEKRVAEMEKLAKQMKEILVAKMAGK